MSLAASDRALISENWGMSIKISVVGEAAARDRGCGASPGDCAGKEGDRGGEGVARGRPPRDALLLDRFRRAIDGDSDGLATRVGVGVEVLLAASIVVAPDVLALRLRVAPTIGLRVLAPERRLESA